MHHGIRASLPDLVSAYGRTYKELRNALFAHNPVEVSGTDRREVYIPIAGTVLSRWEEISSREDLSRILQEEVSQWNIRIGAKLSKLHEQKFDKAALRTWVRLYNPSWKSSERYQDKLTTAERRERQKYAELYYNSLKVLNKYDPIGIGYTPVEYDLEVETIILRLVEPGTVNELRLVVQEEFSRWFWPEIASRDEPYGAIALELWELWQRYKNK